MSFYRFGLAVTLIVAAAFAQAQFTLGSFTFNNNLFGDTLVESDGGTFSSANWLNTSNADPGNPGYLTGVGVETGIANIPQGPTYTIGYNTPIVNGAGDDLGIIVARFSFDNLFMSVSTNGVDFSASQAIFAASGIATGEFRDYYYGSAGTYQAELFVHPLDLGLFGVGAGESIVAVRVETGPDSSQLDLIRVAGMNAVPEPATVAILGLGALPLLRKRKRA